MAPRLTSYRAHCRSARCEAATTAEMNALWAVETVKRLLVLASSYRLWRHFYWTVNCITHLVRLRGCFTIWLVCCKKLKSILYYTNCRLLSAVAYCYMPPATCLGSIESAASVHAVTGLEQGHYTYKQRSVFCTMCWNTLGCNHVMNYQNIF